MSEEFMLWLLAALLAVIIALLGFMGTMLFNKIDTIFTLLAKLESDVRKQISELSNRLLVVETLQNIKERGTHNVSNTPNRSSKTRQQPRKQPTKPNRPK